VSSRKLVGRRIAAHLVKTGLSPEDFGNQVGLSGMTIRRLLDEAAETRPNNRTKALVAKGLDEDPGLLWPGAPAVYRRVAA
jgi:lambda repressor-like predicted transcriptional regulator